MKIEIHIGGMLRSLAWYSLLTLGAYCLMKAMDINDDIIGYYVLGFILGMIIVKIAQIIWDLVKLKDGRLPTKSMIDELDSILTGIYELEAQSRDCEACKEARSSKIESDEFCGRHLARYKSLKDAFDTHVKIHHKKND